MATPDRPWRVPLLCAVAVVPHLPSITGPFIDDDLPYLAGNASVHSLVDALGLLVREYPADGLYRPLTGITYALGWEIWGRSPLAFHVLALVLWALTALAVDAFARRHLAPGRALAVALLFLAHPAHCEVVDHLTGIADLLSTLLLFVALLVRGWLALPIFFLALLAKESAAVLPLPLVLTVLLDPNARLRVLAPYGLVVAAWAALKLHAVGSLRPHDVMIQDPTLLSWAATLGGIALGYLRILVFPLDLAVDRAYRVGVGVHYRFDASAAVGLALVLTVVAVFVLALARERRPAHLAYGIGWALASMAPYAHAVPFGALMAERFLHTALFGFAWALVAVAPASRVLLAAVVLAWSARSAVRSADWRDPVAIWAPIVERYPDDPLAHLALGRILLEAGRTADARAELERGLALNPHSGAGRTHLGMALLREGDLVGARAQFEAALGESDDHANAMNGLGTIAGRQGRLITARTWFTNALAIEPGHAQASENLRDTEATIERARQVRDEQLRAPTDPRLLRQACEALEDPACP